MVRLDSLHELSLLGGQHGHGERGGPWRLGRRFGHEDDLTRGRVVFKPVGIVDLGYQRSYQPLHGCISAFLRSSFGLRSHVGKK